MAEVRDIDALRNLLNDNDLETASFTNEQLAAMLDGVGGSVKLAAAEGWGILATRYSTLVDTSEMGSIRKMGDLYKNAIAIRDMFLGEASTEGAKPGGRTRIGRIVRP